MSRKRKPETQELLVEIRLSPEDQTRAARLMTQKQGIATIEEALLWSLRQASEPVFFWKGRLVVKEKSLATSGNVSRFGRVPDDDYKVIAKEHKVTPSVAPQVELQASKDAALARAATPALTRAR